MEFPFQNLPVTAICLVAAVFLAAGVSAAHVFTSDELFGQPAYNAVTHVYTENDHGNVVRVTKATYDRAVTAQNRVFLSGVVAFSALSVGVTSDELIRRRRSPHAKRRRRRPTTA
jgi:putative intracellular protease/amidase